MCASTADTMCTCRSVARHSTGLQCMPLGMHDTHCRLVCPRVAQNTARHTEECAWLFQDGPWTWVPANKTCASLLELPLTGCEGDNCRADLARVRACLVACSLERTSIHTISQQQCIHTRTHPNANHATLPHCNTAGFQAGTAIQSARRNMCSAACLRLPPVRPRSTTAE